tara:strand:+ start:264 stop:917 length:654 start_codon:yes stop_codon:yes gene_type:complete
MKHSEMKKRFLTSVGLLLALFFMYENKIFYTFSIMIVSVLAFIEFSNIGEKIYKIKFIKKFIFNFLFIIYIFLISISLVYLVVLLNLKNLVFILLIICIFSDIGGLLFGKIFKGPKLTKISPNKTISGSIGSILFSIFISVATIFIITDIISYMSIILGLITSLGAQVGDLFFSFLKRKAKIKNTGNVLPGHGGVLDRIDGILLGLPVGLITLIILH